MELILLDVDGTLTDTARVDAECFVQAVSDVFGISDVDTDWSVYPDTTDAAIASHLVQQVHGKFPSPTEIAELRDRFLVLLRAAIGSDASRCRPIPGGPAFVRTLVESPAFSVAIATGGWEESARFKLERAGYNISDVPMASSSDATRRTEILALAAQRASAAAGDGSFSAITYVGDGIWDARAAAALGHRFIGRGDPTTSGLVAEGAERVVRDFSDVDGLLRLITRTESTGSQVQSTKYQAP
ncbi:MAG TPA: HAD family hydrolase [Rhodothermales bacterium]|nr:HAD family hydrolase [Rhodothermales bacterium]